MPSKDGIMNHLTCLLYLNLGKFKILKIMNLASNCRYPLWFPLLCQTWVWLSWSLSSLDPKQLQQETPHFIGLWPPNSPGLNPVDYKVRGVMQQRVYECRVNSVDELKQRFVEVWNSLGYSTLLTRPSTSGESDWQRACVQMDNILNIYCERVRLTKVTDK